MSPECRKHSPWSFLRIGSPEHLLFCLNPPYFSGHKVGRFLEKLYGAILRLGIVRLKRILHLLQLFSRTLQCCFAVKLQECFVFTQPSSCIRVSKLVNFSLWVNLWPVFPALCCRCPNLFEMCCLHWIQNKHISTKIHVVDGVKHYIYCLCSVFNWENVKKDKQMITFWLIFVCFYTTSQLFLESGL